MKHRFLEKISDNHPYEVVRIELIPDNNEASGQILKNNKAVEDYLTIQLEALDIISQSGNEFIIKKVKGNIGI